MLSIGGVLLSPAPLIRRPYCPLRRRLGLGGGGGLTGLGGGGGLATLGGGLRLLSLGGGLGLGGGGSDLLGLLLGGGLELERRKRVKWFANDDDWSEMEF